MVKKKYLFCVILPLWLMVCACTSTGQEADLSKIKENFKKVYIVGSPLTSDLQEALNANPPGFGVSDRVVMELQQRVPFSKAFIEELLAKQNEEGAWTDINYFGPGESLSG